MSWYKVESTTRPAETDTESSGVYNYARRNVREVQRTEDDESLTMYEYEERKIRKEDWDLYLNGLKNTADIDYIAMMTDVELED